MSFRTTFGLIIILALLGAVYLLVPGGGEIGDEMAPATPPPSAQRSNVFDPQPAVGDLVRIELAPHNKPALVFARAKTDDGEWAKDHWRILAPVDAEADRYRVEDLCRTVAQLRSRAQLEPGGDGGVNAAAAGLETPAATVTLTDRDDKTYVLEIGGPVTMSSDTYVRRAGETTIHIAARDLAAELERGTNDYRSKAVATLDADDMVAATFVTGEQSLALTKTARQGWVIESPIHAFAQEEAALKPLRELATLRAVEFVEGEARQVMYGFDDPYVTVKVVSEQQVAIVRDAAAEAATTQPTEPEYETVREALTLEIGGVVDLEGEQRYARLAGQDAVFTISGSAADRLRPRLAELRDPRVTRLSAADITRIVLHVAGAEVTLERDGADWRGMGAVTAIDEPTVATLAQTLADLRAIDFVDAPKSLAEYGLDEPRAVLEVHARDLAAPLTLRVGANTASGRNTFVQVAGQESVLVIGGEPARQIALTPLQLQSRSVLRFQPSELATLTVAHERMRYELRQEGGAWQLLVPEGAPLDLAGVRTLTTNLAALRASALLSADDPAAAALESPDVTIELAGATAAAADGEAGPPQTVPFAHYAARCLRGRAGALPARRGRAALPA